jgi:hypothetical protein
MGSVSRELGSLGSSQEPDPLDPAHPLRPGAAQGHVPIGLLDGQQDHGSTDLLIRVELLLDPELVDEFPELLSARQRNHFFPC